MKILIFAVFLLSTLRAQPLPVIPMQTNDPDQLAQGSPVEKSRAAGRRL